MKYTIVAAISDNNVIGIDNKLPWYYPEDLKRFKEMTLNHPVVMGRKTYQSIKKQIGGPLPQRQNIVLTRNQDFNAEGVEIVHSLEEICSLLNNQDNYSTAFIIGGQNVYEQTLPFVDRLEITHIHKVFKGDSFFPEINSNQWKKENSKDFLKYSFVTYSRKN